VLMVIFFLGSDGSQIGKYMRVKTYRPKECKLLTLCFWYCGGYLLVPSGLGQKQQAACICWVDFRLPAPTSQKRRHAGSATPSIFLPARRYSYRA